MTVRAFDLGTPSLYSDVNVKVFILDQNDHAPKVPFPLILLRVAITLIPVSVSITSVPISTFKPTNTRWTNEHFRLLSYCKDLRQKSNPIHFQFQTHKYWVDIPEDTPGGTPVLQVSSLTLITASLEKLSSLRRETVCRNMTNGNRPSCCSGESQ